MHLRSAIWLVITNFCLTALLAAAAAASDDKLSLFIDVQVPKYGLNTEVDLDVLETRSKHSVDFLKVSCDFEPLSGNFVAAIKRTLKEDKDAVPENERQALITVRGEDENGEAFSVQRERVFYFGASEVVGHNIDSNHIAVHLCIFTIDTPY